jgi:hypothetical protein
MEFASFHPSGAYDFEVAPMFFFNLSTPGLQRYRIKLPKFMKGDQQLPHSRLLRLGRCEAQLRRPAEVDGDTVYEYEVPGGT